MAVAAFALHQLRYLLAPGGTVDQSEHAYVPLVAGAVVLLFAFAAGELAHGVARARDDGAAEGEPPPFRITWLVASGGLLAIFTAQELTEVLLAGGALVDPFAAGGLWALPLSLVLGALVALALSWAGRAVLAAARRHLRRRRRSLAVPRPAWRPPRPASSVLARHLAGRAPPLTS
jgi:hypothetical protein